MLNSGATYLYLAVQTSKIKQTAKIQNEAKLKTEAANKWSKSLLPVIHKTKLCIIYQCLHLICNFGHCT